MRSKRKLVYGIGINDANYTVCPVVEGKRAWCPYYRAWTGMLERCYCSKFQAKQPTYVGCAVTNEWRVFSAFRVWMVAQSWEGMELDKDLLIPGNKIYSPDTCLFVSRAVNLLLTDHAAARGPYPQGVSWHKGGAKYQAKCSVNGKRKHIGYFKTINEAEIAYLDFKSALIEDAAESQPDIIKKALLRHAVAIKTKGQILAILKGEDI